MSQRYIMYIILALAAIGLLVSARQLLIPIGVFGVIYLLWKYPPDRWMGRARSSKSGPASRSEKRRKGATTKTGKFRVIDGSKKKEEQDDTPKYH